MGILMRLMGDTDVNVSYGITPIHQAVLGMASDSLFNIGVLGHTMSLWDNIAVMAVFGIVMTLLAMWSFGSQGWAFDMAL